MTERSTGAVPGETRRVVTSGGLRLAVFEHADAEGPVVLFVHGYPDSHVVWDRILAELGPTVRTARYDVRGAGASEVPRTLRGYNLDNLADDLFYVVRAVSPDRPVHLVAHDWGSTQAWHAVTDIRAERHLASFTTISGPCLDHAGFWFRERFRRPTPRHVAQLLSQGTKSWYVYAFQLPLVPALAWRLTLARNWGETLRRIEGIEPEPGHPQPTLTNDAVNGLNLYRANMLPRLMRPEFRYARVPVQIISPLEDRFVGPALSEGLERWAPDLRRHALACGHWGALTRRAAETAALVKSFVDETEFSV